MNSFPSISEFARVFRQSLGEGAVSGTKAEYLRQLPQGGQIGPDGH
jgi:hypothetical protein